MPFNQKSPRPPEEGVLNCHKQTHTHTETDGHGDSMTELAQLGQFSEIIALGLRTLYSQK